MPDSWGRFEVRGELGRGARSRVMRAYDNLWREEVALKVWSAGATEGLDELRRDFRLLSRTPCRHLPRVRDLVEHEGNTALVMELVEGHDLAQVLGEMDPRELAAGLFGAIDALHAAGIVHGDIKPDNVRVRPDGTVVLVDLGLAYSAAHPRTSLDGTLYYFSPEQLNQESWGTASDIYTAGLVLHEVVAAPLDDLALQRRFQTTLSRQTILLPPMGDPALADVLRRCLQPDPDRRPTAAQCLEALAAKPSVEPTSTSSTAPRALADRWLRSSQPRLAVVADPNAGRAFAHALARAAVGGQTATFRFGGNRSDLRPLHALEGLVDDLSSHLDRLDEADRTVLEYAFPTFAPGRGDTAPGPGPRHREVARALGSLVAARVGTGRSTVFVIENAQWVDRDSERILVHLLDDSDIRACVVSTTDEAPLFARVVDEAQRADLAPVEDPTSTLPDEAARLASLLVSLGGRVSTELALEHGSARAIDALDDHGLLDWTLDASTIVLVRVPPGLPPIPDEALRKVLADLGEAPPEIRAGLHRVLGDHELGVPEAIESARQALARGAPAAAHRWLEYALEHDDRAEIHALMSRSLADQNQPLAAAQARMEAAERVNGETRGHHLAEASDLWLRAGDVDRGLATLHEACGLLGFSLPRSGWYARFTTVVDLIWLSRNALELEPVEQPEPPRLVAAWAAASPLAYFDFAQAGAMLVRYLRMALEDQHLDHAVRAAALLWNALALSRRGSSREVDRLDRFLERWTPQASQVSRAFVATTRAYVMLYTNEMGRSGAALADALALYPPTEDGGWAPSAARVNRLLANHFSAAPDARWRAQVERLSTSLADRSDRLASGLCEMGVRYLVPLHDEDADAATKVLDDEVARQGEMPAAYRWIAAFARCRIALFADRPDDARAVIGRRPPRDLAALQHVRTGHAWLRGLAEVAAARAGLAWSPRVLRRCIRVLHDEQPHWGAGHVEALTGSLAALEGRPAEARNRIRRAVSLYADAGLHGFVDAEGRGGRWRSLFWPAVPEGPKGARTNRES